jgi:hypothetical protein
MEFMDLIVLIFFLFVLIGLSYSKSHKDQIAFESENIISEGFQNSPPTSNINIYLFYSMTSVVPGKKCKENYKLYKENRYYLQLWNKFKQWMIINQPNVQMKTINIDDNPEYVEQFNIEKTPVIYMEKDGQITKLTRENLPTLKELVNTFKNNSSKIVKDLSQYNDAIIYLYVPNCRDCKKYLYEWLVFKKDLKNNYPDIQVFEVDVSKNPSYKKYTYKFSPSVYPLILTKNSGKIVTTDLRQMYGQFNAENLLALTEEYFFNQAPEEEIFIVENQTPVNSLQEEQDKINELISFNESDIIDGEGIGTETGTEFVNETEYVDGTEFVDGTEVVDDFELYNQGPINSNSNLNITTNSINSKYNLSRFPIPSEINLQSVNKTAVSRPTNKRFSTNPIYSM